MKQEKPPTACQNVNFFVKFLLPILWRREDGGGSFTIEALVPGPISVLSVVKERFKPDRSNFPLVCRSQIA